MLLVQHGANVNARSEDGQTPLHNAAHSGYPEIVLYLIEHGADVNARAHDGRTPLFTVTREPGLAERFITPFGLPSSDLEMKEWSGRREVAAILHRHGAKL